MSPPRLWVVRHGETEWSLSGQHTSRTDLPLTEAGEAEAVALKPSLAKQAFSLVLSSPRQRALATAHLAGFEPVVDEDLAEWDYGELEGLTTDEIKSRYPGWTIWKGPWPGGETAQQVGDRADRVVARVRELSDGADVLVFAHGHILRVLTARWLELAATEGRLFMLGTATVGILSYEHGQPAVERWDVPPEVATGTSL